MTLQIVQRTFRQCLQVVQFPHPGTASYHILRDAAVYTCWTETRKDFPAQSFTDDLIIVTQYSYIGIEQ